jgi:prepilin-type N-terminal cleavage/methylation domain-containing protein
MIHHDPIVCRADRSGMTLLEMLIATGIGSLLLAAVATLTLYGTQSFAGIVNYVDLDAKSGNTLDRVSRELRLATAVIASQTNLTARSTP